MVFNSSALAASCGVCQRNSRVWKKRNERPRLSYAETVVRSGAHEFNQVWQETVLALCDSAIGFYKRRVSFPLTLRIANEKEVVCGYPPIQYALRKSPNQSGRLHIGNLDTHSSSKTSICVCQRCMSPTQSHMLGLVMGISNINPLRNWSMTMVWL